MPPKRLVFNYYHTIPKTTDVPHTCRRAISPTTEENPTKNAKTHQDSEHAPPATAHKHHDEPNDVPHQPSQTVYASSSFNQKFTLRQTVPPKTTSFEIMHNLTPIQPTKILQTGRDSGLISQMNIRAPFGHDSKILKYIYQSLLLCPLTQKLCIAVLKALSSALPT
jgi:hypothetical protein